MPSRQVAEGVGHLLASCFASVGRYYVLPVGVIVLLTSWSVLGKLSISVESISLGVDAASGAALMTSIVAYLLGFMRAISARASQGNERELLDFGDAVTGLVASSVALTTFAVCAALIDHFFDPLLWPQRFAMYTYLGCAFGAAPPALFCLFQLRNS
jgi:hypothetical protein